MTATKPKPSMREALAHLKRPASPSASEFMVGLVPRRHRGKPKLKPLQRIDALLRVPLFTPLRGTAFAVEPSKGRDNSFNLTSAARIVTTNRARPAPRSWRDAAARFEKLGYVIVPAPGDTPRVTLASPGGRAEPEAIAAFEKVADWIAAGRAGKPWSCAWCKVEAATLLAGDVPACTEHAAA